MSIKDLEILIGDNFEIVRAMPNTAISIKESMTCISYNNIVGNATIEAVEHIFSLLGKSIIIDDDLMDAATVLGACGTAYAMRYIRAVIQGGIEIGFNAKIATTIVAQTLKGAAALILTNDTHPEAEIDKVTTPKGCTIAGLNEIEHCGFSSSLIKGIKSSYNKITEA